MRHLLVVILSVLLLNALPKEEVHWLTFEELETALANAPKKVIIHFYADWCVYCKKMEQSAYSKPDIIETLNAEYYAVKFNVESTDEIEFGGKRFINANVGKKRNPYHQIPEYLAGRENEELELPATVFLDEDFNIVERYYWYLSPKEMRDILKEN
ncbi:MAG: thioredoxin fold domain-containing protein [Winogradskyella sp.]|uniref:thioredoxin family protein n=1 Tax=Winogradskyella sp. TaxID=1883156 RepID=UPI0025CEA077|nr:thioredoxin fold domain-containing protein [Winogradskyella sp.]NRB59458.1 thioredoxin fold domain-containing protein [Winogradskyella sp.]